MPAPTRLLRPLPLVLALQAASGGYALAADFTVGSGTTLTTGQQLPGAGVVEQDATLTTGGGTVAVTVNRGTSTLSNAGTIRQTGSGRAIDVNDGTPVFSLVNHRGALIDASGNVAIRLNRAAGSYLIDNQGTISQSGPAVGGERAIKADAEYSSTGNQVINGAADNRDAVISSTGNDALRLGNNFTLTNYGRIFSTGAVNTSCPGYLAPQCVQDISAADGVAIENARANVAILNHGSIDGPRHGIDGGDPLAAVADAHLFGLERLVVASADGNGVTFDKVVDGVTTRGIQILNPVVINYADGTITGHNGSGVGLDGHGVVFNYGTISGRYAGAGNVFDHEGLGLTTDNGDGDGVDIDGMAYIENHGRIEGLGAGGFDSGGNPNGADGIAAGGGTIVNLAGASIFGQSAGILIDDGANGSAFAPGRGTAEANGGAARIDNAGSIVGADKVAIGLVGDFADLLINRAGGLIQGGAQSVRVDELGSSTAAAAVQMGGGNDRLLNLGTIEGRNGLAVDMGSGDDLLIVGSSGRFIGTLDGGSGHDVVQLDDSLGGSFGNSRQFEWLDVRSGSWTLDSGGDFSEGGRVFAGAGLINQGSLLGDLQVDSGARYAGSGHIGGDLRLAGGATLAFAVSPDGAQAPVQVGGQASLDGAHLQVLAGPGSYAWQSQYRVLDAAGGVSGQFADVASNLAFLTPSLSYSANAVDLQLKRNDVQFGDAAGSANGRQVGASLSALQAGNPLYDALLTSSLSSAGEALEQLSASANANLASAMLGSSAQIGASMLAALQSPTAAGGLQTALLDGDAPLLAATGLPAGVRNLNDPQAQGRLWLQGLGSHGQVDGSDGASDLDQDTRGVVLGADWALDGEWRMGLLGGYSRTDLEAGSAFDGEVDSLHLGLYALRQSGPLALRLGAAYSRHDGDSKRRVDFNGFSDRLRGDYDADSQQAFAELGYALGDGRLSAEPFANLGYQRYSRDAYREQGGPAALRVESQEQDNLTSTLGLRIARLDTLGNGIGFTPRLSVAWRHTYGDVDSRSRQAFLSGGSGFSVEGSALDRNSLLLGVGADFRLGAQQQVGLGYSGELGGHAQNHALIAQWQLGF
ncbi:outer membrane autotransporter barrel domain protein [compost metagenome]